MNITFIGGGNMATALIKGLVNSSRPDGFIHVVEPSEKAREMLGGIDGVSSFASSSEAIAGADVILLAVKPQVIPMVLSDLAGRVSKNQLVVSVAAGITVGAIQQALGESVPVVRTMPNTPALLGCGISGMFAGPGCSRQDRETAESIMRKAGEIVWVEPESQIDAVTAISGSGPAYFFLLAEALQKAGAGLGLDPDVALKLAIHTAHGAGAMAVAGDADISELRRRVTSPGGTTQAALETLAEGGFVELVCKAAEAALRRSLELSGAGGAS